MRLKLRHTFGTIVTHPLVIHALNLSLLILAYTGFKYTILSQVYDSESVHHAVEIWEGYGTIILGFGVLLEERISLKEIFKVERKNDPTDQPCHDYGVGFVMLGVLIEVLAWLVKIPNSVLDEPWFEYSLLCLAAVSAVVVVLMQLRFFINTNKT